MRVRVRDGVGVRVRVRVAFDTRELLGHHAAYTYE